jgi:hypothetical protein
MDVNIMLKDGWEVILVALYAQVNQELVRFELKGLDELLELADKFEKNSNDDGNL